MQNDLLAMKMTMELRGFAKSTERTYLAHLQRFQDFCDKPIHEAGYEEVRAFLHHAINVRNVSSAYVNSAYRAILSTIYAAGLRVSEAAHLKVSDIDSGNMRILVRQSKGHKDRCTILSQNNLLLLRQYWNSCRPIDWLFPGMPDTKPIAVRTIQSVFKQSLSAAGLGQNASVHSLRHSFATHLLNQGDDILQIKHLLGHADIQTTSLYLHLTHAQVLGLTSPLDHHNEEAQHD